MTFGSAYDLSIKVTFGRLAGLCARETMADLGATIFMIWQLARHSVSLNPPMTTRK